MTEPKIFWEPNKKNFKNIKKINILIDSRFIKETLQQKVGGQLKIQCFMLLTKNLIRMEVFIQESDQGMI